MFRNAFGSGEQQWFPRQRRCLLLLREAAQAVLGASPEAAPMDLRLAQALADRRSWAWIS